MRGAGRARWGCVAPVLVLVFAAIMTFEADHTLFTRESFFGAGPG